MSDNTYKIISIALFIGWVIVGIFDIILGNSFGEIAKSFIIAMLFGANAINVLAAANKRKE